MASSPSSAPHPVDQVPSFARLTVLGIQHVLAFYAGAVIVPWVIAQNLGLDTQTLIHLINADLFTCGIATIIQSAGTAASSASSSPSSRASPSPRSRR